MINLQKNILQAKNISSSFYSLFLIIIGTCFLSYTSEIIIPLQPIPITMQTIAVSLIGAIYGWHLGMITVVAFLLQHFFRISIFTLSSYSIETFFNFQVGYLFAFPLSAGLVGWIVEKNKNTFNSKRIFCAFLSGHSLCLFLGTIWLSIFVGLQKAFFIGFLPFISIELIKAGLASIIFLSCLYIKNLLSNNSCQ